ncbi:cytochrome b5 reductase 4-like [Haliotis cracherodii]|uniref:cytochrome b5 reductase 4-like n=1 Tax=Haliotis cracherodii TaxID=6455 RepID=UPI0039ECE035
MAGPNLTVPQFPAANSQQRISPSPSAGRNKVALKPGRSLMDWIRLGRSGQDLTGVGGKVLEVSSEELAKHSRPEDSWIALRGKVYNITPYLEFHPGGIDELMRGAGKDGTQLFDEVHKWVNAESMLEKCLVGRLKVELPTSRRGSATSRGSTRSNTLSPNGSINPLNLKPPSGPQPPRHDWFQNAKSVTIVVYTKWLAMKDEFVTIDLNDRKLKINIFLETHTYQMHIELEKSIIPDYNVKVHKDNGKVEIIMPKSVTDEQWQTLGTNQSDHGTLVKTAEREVSYRQCTIQSIQEVSPDTKLLCVQLPEGTRMCVPLGYHVHIKHNISGMELARSYTVVFPSLRSSEQDILVEQGRVLYLMIKIYPDGALTPWIGGLSVGSSLEVSDIDGNFQSTQLEKSTQLILMAAGTGFTPMVRLLYQTLVVEQDSKRHVKLMFFNKTKKDILWKDQLDELVAKNDSRLSVTYVLSEPDSEWEGPKGRVREELMKKEMPTMDDGTNLLVCACGPTPFTKEVVRLAKTMGCKDEQLHAFLG